MPKKIPQEIRRAVLSMKAAGKPNKDIIKAFDVSDSFITQLWRESKYEVPESTQLEMSLNDPELIRRIVKEELIKLLENTKLQIR